MVSTVNALPWPVDFGITPDGTVTVVSLSEIALVDRRSGLLPGIRPIALPPIRFSMVQPNGMVTVETPDDFLEVHSFAGGGMVEEARDSDGTPVVAGEVYPEPDGVWAVSADDALGR